MLISFHLLHEKIRQGWLDSLLNSKNERNIFLFHYIKLELTHTHIYSTKRLIRYLGKNPLLISYVVC